MHLRPATPSDASDTATLHAESWRFAYRGALSDEYLARRVVVDREALWTERFLAPKANQYVAVAQTQGQLAGFACVFTAEHPEWGSLLDNIHVRAALQGKGIGTALLSSIARWCLSNAVHGGMYLWVLQSNLSAQRFYTRLGARNVGVDVWHPPGGGSVPRYCFSWHSVQALAGEAVLQKHIPSD